MTGWIMYMKYDDFFAISKCCQQLESYPRREIKEPELCSDPFNIPSEFLFCTIFNPFIRLSSPRKLAD